MTFQMKTELLLGKHQENSCNGLTKRYYQNIDKDININFLQKCKI